MKNINNSPITRRSKSADPNVLASSLATKASQSDLNQRSINLRQPPYNAPADGVNDCSPAINSAIAALPNGGVIYCPAGTGSYRFLSKISPNANTTILGDGNTVFEMDSWIEANTKDNVVLEKIQFKNCKKKIFFMLNNKNCKVLNCTLDTNSINYPNGGVSAYDSYSIHLYNATDVKIKDNAFINSKGDNVIRIENTYSTDGKICTFDIADNKFDTTSYKCVAFAYTSSNMNNSNNRGYIRRNRFLNIGINHPTDGVGTVAVYSWYDRTNYDVDVNDNYFDTVVENGVEGTFGKIMGNTFKTCGYQTATSTTSSGSGVSAYGSRFVKNNTFITCRLGGIKVFLTSSYTMDVKNVQWSGNHFNMASGVDGINVNVTSKVFDNVFISQNTTELAGTRLAISCGTVSNLKILDNMLTVDTTGTTGATVR